MSKSTRDPIETVGAGAFAGAISGGLTYWLFSSSSALVWIGAGAVIGIGVGLLWPFLHSFAMRHRIEDWQLEEVTIQGLKFTSAGAQRRVAWRLFVQLTTRIATQPMDDASGDDGVALKSLHDLFQLTRSTIAEMQPTPEARGETVETYALDMLNTDLRPFLSTWHPLWDEFAKGGKPDLRIWPEHQNFRAALRELQGKIEGRARGLAALAGVENSDRFFPPRRAN